MGCLMSILSNLINLDKKNDKYEYVKNHYNHDIDSDDLLYKYTNLNYIKKKISYNC